jgi:copper(I)-binding protein
VKSPYRYRVAIAALLPLLAACGFSAQTDQVYQAPVGVNDRSGDVDILNALVVSGQDGSGTFAGTLVNKADQDDTLDSVSGSGITGARRSVEVPAEAAVPLADKGEISLKSSAIKPGSFVELTFGFDSGQTTTIKVPVVSATGDYADVPLPTTATSPSASASATE